MEQVKKYDLLYKGEAVAVITLKRGDPLVEPPYKATVDGEEHIYGEAWDEQLAVCRAGQAFAEAKRCDDWCRNINWRPREFTR